ncbi:MAG: hypothetical protein CL843_06025 [Crocinitomicaceae bacterium]|nr:hypothetical protein [Crocinitomicaceae bacterium]
MHKVSLFIFLFSLLSVPLTAQKTEKFLEHRLIKDGHMYFIHDLEYSSNSKGSYIENDFTFTKTTTNVNAICNTSLYSKTAKGIPDSVVVSNASEHYTIHGDQIQLFYAEKEKKHWKSRLSIPFEENQFSSLLSSAEGLTFEFYYGEVSYTMTLKKKFFSVLEEAYEIIQLNTSQSSH